MHLRMRYMSRGSGINFRKILGHDIMMACSDCVVVQVLITLMYGDYRCDEKLWPPLQIIKLRLFIHEHAQQPRHISMATSFISYLYHRQQFQRELHFGIFGAHKQQHECSESPQAIKFARETFSSTLIHYFNEVTLQPFIREFPGQFYIRICCISTATLCCCYCYG